MGFRFFRRVRIAPGLTLNLSKSGPSFSFGPRGLKYTVGPRGTRKTFGLPGTGLYYTTSSGWGKKPSPASPSDTAVPPPSALDQGFFSRIFTPPDEKSLVAGLKQYLAGQTDMAYSTFRANTALIDSVFMTGFLALGEDQLQEAESAFLRCRGVVDTLGKAIQKYIQGFRLSLQVTDYIDAPIDVDQRGLALALAETYQKQGKFADAIASITPLWDNDASDVVVCLSLCELVVKDPAATQAELNDILLMTASVENDEPIHTNILYLRGATMYRLQLADAAIQQLSAALRRKADRPDLPP